MKSINFNFKTVLSCIEGKKEVKKKQQQQQQRRRRRRKNVCGRREKKTQFTLYSC
jgi:hypothetical protein